MLIREDLTIAAIELTDRDDNTICFHSLRNSYISFLVNSQAPTKIVQKLSRHSGPGLTFNTCARTFEDAERKAMNLLVNFGDFVFSACLASNRKKQEILVENQRQKKPGRSKNRFLGCTTNSPSISTYVGRTYDLAVNPDGQQVKE